MGENSDPTMADFDLLPCPCCGDDADIQWYGSRLPNGKLFRDDGLKGYLECTGCGLQTDKVGGKPVDEIMRCLAETWNRRTPLKEK